MEKLYTVSKNKTGSRLWLKSVQFSSVQFSRDHELLIAKFRVKLKKVEKSTRSFKYDLHQITYDYTVEVRNRFKGLDLIDRVNDIVQKTGIKTIAKKKK